MKIRVMLLALLLANYGAYGRPVEEARGWQIIEETQDYVIVQNFRSHTCVQTIQIANHGDVYFLIAGPYGWEQYLLHGRLPKQFPKRYLGKDCWLRRTKNRQRLVMTYGLEEPPNLLEGNSPL